MIKNVYQEDKDSEQALFDALYCLMLDIPIDRITVSQILETAHVSRSGFYRRYKDKYDLLNSKYVYQGVPALHREDLEAYRQVFIDHRIDAFF